jgi:hypothetical protein
VADISDVEAALVTTIAGVVYPNGLTNPSGLPSARAAKIFRGWPNSAALDADLKSGLVDISVFPLPGHSRLTTRYPTDWRPLSRQSVTLTATTTPTTATFSGTGALGLLAGVRLAGLAYVYPLISQDTPATVAAALAALVPGASSDGPVLTVPAAPDFLVRIGGQASVQREIRRQSQGFQVTIWAPDPVSRDAAGSLIDGALAATDWVPLPDGSWGWLKYASSSTDDVPTKDSLWKRTLIYTIEYATTQTQTVQTLLFGVLNDVGGNQTTTIIQ